MYVKDDRKERIGYQTGTKNSPVRVRRTQVATSFGSTQSYTKSKLSTIYNTFYQNSLYVNFYVKF